MSAAAVKVTFVTGVIDATSFTSTNTQMAGTVTRSAIFGGVTTPVAHDVANVPDSWQWLVATALIS